MQTKSAGIGWYAEKTETAEYRHTMKPGQKSHLRRALAPGFCFALGLADVAFDVSLLL